MLIHRAGGVEASVMESSVSKAAATAEDDGEHAYNTLAYLIVNLWGFALLLPWNVMLNAIPYFKQTYPSDPSIVFHMTAAYVYPQLPLLLAMVLYGSHFSFGLRILGCLAVQTAAIIAIPILATLHSIWSSLVMIFVIGVTTAILQSTMFGLTSMLPVVFSQGLMSGQGVAGVTAGIAAIVIKATMPDDANTAAMVYFVAAGATLALAAGSYVVMMRLPFMKHHMAKAARATAAAASVKRDDDAAANSAKRTSLNNDEPLLPQESAGSSVSIVSVAKGVWVEATAVFIVFTMTFIVFPGLAPGQLLFQNSLGSLHMSNDWWTLILLLIFNMFDTVGRITPAWYMACRSYLLLILAFVRFAMVPLFYGAAHSWSPGMNDIFVGILMAGFSVTNGYMASIAMMTGPSHVAQHERETAGFIMSFCLQAGILVGSQAAFGFTGGP